MPVRPSIPTIKVTTPDTGIEVELKSYLTYGDNKEIFATIFNDVYVGGEADDKLKTTVSQAQEMIGLTVLKAIVSWNVTEENGTSIEPNKENVEAILTDKDVNFLATQVRSSEDVKKKSVSN